MCSRVKRTLLLAEPRDHKHSLTSKHNTSKRQHCIYIIIASVQQQACSSKRAAVPESWSVKRKLVLPEHRSVEREALHVAQATLC